MVDTVTFPTTPTGQVLVDSGAGSLGGIMRAGNQGEMALTSQINPSTGYPAQVFRWYWENGLVGNTAVIRGLGSNRLSLESNGAITQIANNSRFEFEGYISPRVIFTGYEAASALGKTIDFNNYGQTPSRANPVVSISVENVSDDPLHIGRFDGSTWTTLARFNGQGILFAPLFNTQRGMSCTVTGETTSRFYSGLSGTNVPFIAMGPGGTTPLDTHLYRAGTNMFGVGGFTAAFPAIKRDGSGIQVRAADDSDFTKVQGKITTDTNAASGTFTPDKYMILYDAAGVAYKVPCIAA